MFLKALICSTLMCLTIADVKNLSRMYLPPSPEMAIAKTDLVVKKLKFDSLEPFTKNAANDPAYGPNPFGYNGLPVGFPGTFPVQGFPGQGYPGQGFPPPHGFPAQGFPGQGFPLSQGFVNPGFAPQGVPGQGFPSYQGPVQGFPGQGFPGQGFPFQRFPPSPSYPSLQNFVYPGFTGQGYTNYPVYHSSEQLKEEEKKDGEDHKLRLLAGKSDTQYDAENGGYLYKEPTVTF